MELKQAIKKIKSVADAEVFDHKAWDQCEKILVEHNVCPGCLVNDDQRVKLGPWQPGNAENYAGKECPLCEDFFVCGEQAEYDNTPDCFSDADSGL